MAWGHGECRLKRQYGGRGHFAHVAVELARRGDGADVTVATEMAGAKPATHADWFGAVAAGCHDGLRLAVAVGIDVEPWQVRVVRLVGLEADTAADGLRTAAALATVEAFGLQDRFVPVFAGGWTIGVPA